MSSYYSHRVSILTSTTIQMSSHSTSTDHGIPMRKNAACKEDKRRVQITLRRFGRCTQQGSRISEVQGSACPYEIKDHKLVFDLSCIADKTGRKVDKAIKSDYKSVRFNTRRDIRRIERRTSAEARKSWFCEQEYQDMQEDVEMTLKMRAAGLANGTERREFCDRGLKEKSSKYRNSTKERMWGSRRAVYELQEHFRVWNGEADKLRGESYKLSTYSIDFKERTGTSARDEVQTIATVYKEFSRSFRRDAYRIGLADAHVARAQWNFDSSPVIPRRHSATSP